MPHIHSGACLAAMFHSIEHEHRRLKNEAVKIKAEVKALADADKGSRPAAPGRLATLTRLSAAGLA